MTIFQIPFSPGTIYLEMNTYFKVIYIMIHWLDYFHYFR